MIDSHIPIYVMNHSSVHFTSILKNYACTYVYVNQMCVCHLAGICAEVNIQTFSEGLEGNALCCPNIILLKIHKKVLFVYFQVNILLSIFTEEEKASNSAEKTSVVNEINRYNRRFSGEPLAVSIISTRTKMHFLTR